MKPVPASAARSRGPVLRGTHRVGYVRFPAAVALTELGVAFLLGALVDLGNAGSVSLEFLLAGLVAGGLGVSELRRLEQPNVTSPPAVMTMATIAWIVLAAGGAIGNLLADATDDINTAIFEGTAAATTTAMTGLDTDTLPDGLILFRSLLQWFGGFGALVVAMIVIPLVMGGRELRTHGNSSGGSRALITGRARGTSNMAGLYVGFTALLIVAFALAGLGVFDAVIHGLGTASTGGLSSRTASLAAFDSAAVEWVAAFGMAIAGTSIGVIWWLTQRRWRPVVRSTEVRIYVGVMIASTAAIALWLGSDLGPASSLRGGAVAVTSAMSTTGFTTHPWWLLDNGAQALLLILVGIGSMAGSAGGGFRYQRLLEAAGYAKRELRRQLHPTAVGVVRINGRAVDERTLSRLTGYMMLFIICAAIGGMLVDLGDSDLTARNAITLSVSALTTAGPQIVDPVDLSAIGWLSKISLSALMLIGRLSIFGVIVAVITVGSRARQSMTRRVERSVR